MMITCIDSRIYTITHGAPKIQVSSTTIDFHEGGGAFLLMSQDIMRFSSRSLRVTSGQEFTVYTPNFHHTLSRQEWQESPCHLSPFAMCELASGKVFPASKVGSQVGYRNPWEGLVSSCSSGTGKVITNTDQYDVTSCDILDESLDIVYHQGILYYRISELTWWKYWVLVIGSVYLVRSISLNVMSKLPSSLGMSGNSENNHTNSIPQQYPTLLANGILWLIITLDTHPKVFVTENDQLFYWVTQAYIVGYLLFHSYHCFSRLISPQPLVYLEPRIFNLTTASLQLAAMKLYQSSETPYVLILVSLFSVRIWEKLQVHSLSFVLTGLVDCMYVSLLLEVGFEYDLYYLCPLLIVTRIISMKILGKS